MTSDLAPNMSTDAAGCGRGTFEPRAAGRADHPGVARGAAPRTAPDAGHADHRGRLHGVWLASLAAGGSLWSGSVHGPVDHALARNAVLIADGQWWRALSYGTLNLPLFAFVYAMALFVLAGLQVERTYGTVRFLAVLVPSWTAGALVGLLVEPAAAFNAGTSGATFGVAAAATIDLLRRGVPWHRTFWVPTLAVILVLGLHLPGQRHLGRARRRHPGRRRGRRRRLRSPVHAATRSGSPGRGSSPRVVTAATLLAVTPAARHTVRPRAGVRGSEVVVERHRRR